MVGIGGRSWPARLLHGPFVLASRFESVQMDPFASATDHKHGQTRVLATARAPLCPRSVDAPCGSTVQSRFAPGPVWASSHVQSNASRCTRPARTPEDPCTQSSRPAESNTASRSAPSSRSSCSTSSPARRSTLDRVLLVADGDEASIGRPLVADAAVSAEVVRQDRGDKMISFKYRPKARRRVKKGHRQELTGPAHHRRRPRTARARPPTLAEGRRPKPRPSASASRRRPPRRPPRTPPSPPSSPPRNAAEGRAPKADAKPDAKAKAETKAAPKADAKSRREADHQARGEEHRGRPPQGRRPRPPPSRRRSRAHEEGRVADGPQEGRLELEERPRQRRPAARRQGRRRPARDRPARSSSASAG